MREIVYNKLMINENYANMNLLDSVQENVEKINNILCGQSLNSQNLKILISAYENLYNYTNDIRYKKNIADIYYFYFNQKEKALNSYLEYVSRVHNDSSVLHIIASIYKSLKDNVNYKKFLDMALCSSYEKVGSPIPKSEDLVLGINIGVAAGLSMNDDIKYGVETYKKIMQYSPIPNNILTPYLDLELKKADELFNDKEWQEAMIKYKNIFNSSTLEENEFVKLISCLAELQQTDVAMEYLKLYEERTSDKVRADYVVADLMYFKFNRIPEAIERYERYIKYNKDDALVYNTLGHLYSELYNDRYLDKQLNYFLKAHELNPNSRTFTRNVALIYNKLGDFKNADKYYKTLLNINPTFDDYFDYGCFLIQHGDFQEGYKYFAFRFRKENKPALYPPMLPANKELTNKDDIKGHTVLVQCEQGFGDTIMYARFVKQISKLAKKVIFIVQTELVDLFKSSNLGAEILGSDTDFSELVYDYHVPIMNLPLFLETTTADIPDKEGYISVDTKKVEHFAYEFVANQKNLKVGLAFEGHNVSRDLNRDVELEQFIPIMKMKGVDIYILQHEDSKKQIPNLPKGLNFINVGKDFSTFEDTAAAIKNMDLVISTDNVILNLAGALGVKTYGVFNKFTEYRWFDLSGEDVKWYKSVKPYQAKDMNIWKYVIGTIKKDIKA